MKSQRKILPGGVVKHTVGFVLPDTLPSTQWRALLRAAIRDYSSSRWQLGDLLLHGETAGYGETYDAAIEETGLSYQTIANIKSVSKRFKIYRRRESLAFGHHAEVAVLPDAEQDRLLDLAASAGWSRRALREEVAKIRAVNPALVDDAVAEEAARTLRLEIKSVPIPLSPVPIVVTSSAPLVSPESKAVIDALDLKQLHSPPTSLRVIGGASENEALAFALE
jgi:hypothetical protein